MNNPRVPPPDVKALAHESPTAALACVMAALDRIDSPRAWFSFQDFLLREMLHTERAARGTDGASWRAHLRHLKHVGDGTAQKLVDAHTLRQLYKNTPSSASLASQQDGLAATLGCAFHLAETGRTPLMADLTNLIRIGDVLDCSNREYPKIYEVKKSRPARSALRKRNRVGRQVARMKAVVHGLNTGQTQMPGQSEPHFTRLSREAFEHDMDRVDSVVESAIRGRRTASVNGNHDIIMAGPSSDSIEILCHDALERFGGDAGRQLFLGTTGRILNEPVPSIPSPTVWPIPLACRLAITTRQVHLVHIIDLGRFTEAAARHGVRMECLERDPGGHIFSASIAGATVRIRPDAIHDVIFAFRRVAEAAESLARFIADFPEEPTKFSNTEAYRKDQAAAGVPNEAPAGEIVHPENFGFDPRAVLPGRFIDGPWRISMQQDELLNAVISGA